MKASTIRNGVVALAAFATATVAACSSGSSGGGSPPVQCGAGTTLVDDTCVSSQPDGSSGDANAANDSASGADGADLDTSSSMDGADAVDATTYVPDPCPSGAIWANCDTTCSATETGDCTVVKCDANIQGVDDPNIPTLSAPATLRTPNMPTQDGACISECDPTISGIQPELFGMTFRMNPPAIAGDVIELRVGLPWYIDDINAEGAVCPWNPPEGSQVQNCLSGPSGNPWVVLVWTDQANAVARNIEVSEVPEGSACQ
jgi:hypothetical protein